MIIIIDKYISVNILEDGTVAITRPSILGEIATHNITSPYSGMDIASFLYKRVAGHPTPLIQEAFPEMSAEDREFIQSGITPEAWAKVIAEDGEEETVQ